MAGEQGRVLVPGVAERVGAPQRRVDQAQQGGQRPSLPSWAGAASWSPPHQAVGDGTHRRVGDSGRGRVPPRWPVPGAFPDGPAGAVERGERWPSAAPSGVEQLKGAVEMIGKQVPARAGPSRRCPPAPGDGSGSGVTKRNSSRAGRRRGGRATRPGRPVTLTGREVRVAPASAGWPGPEPSRSTTCPKVSTSRRRTGRSAPAMSPGAVGSGGGAGGGLEPTHWPVGSPRRRAWTPSRVAAIMSMLRRAATNAWAIVWVPAPAPGSARSPVPPPIEAGMKMSLVSPRASPAAVTSSMAACPARAARWATPPVSRAGPGRRCRCRVRRRGRRGGRG